MAVRIFSKGLLTDYPYCMRAAGIFVQVLDEQNAFWVSLKIKQELVGKAVDFMQELSGSVVNTDDISLDKLPKRNASICRVRRNSESGDKNDFVQTSEVNDNIACFDDISWTIGVGSRQADIVSTIGGVSDQWILYLRSGWSSSGE